MFVIRILGRVGGVDEDISGVHVVVRDPSYGIDVRPDSFLAGWCIPARCRRELHSDTGTNHW